MLFKSRNLPPPPLENEKFDSDYQKPLDIESIKTICEAESDKIDPETEQEVQKTLNKLKNNKAADYGFVQ